MTLRSLIRGYWRRMLFAASLAALAGSSNGLLLAFINDSLTGSGVASLERMLSYAGLCVLTIAAGFFSWLSLARLGRRASMDLTLRLCGRILATPLPRIQKLGYERLLVTLTDDMDAIANVFGALPELVLNGSLILGCFIYLGLLSWQLTSVLFGTVLIGAIGIRILYRSALRWLRQARDEEDRLYLRFCGVTEGVKELKMNAPLRDTFLKHDLWDSLDRVRRLSIAGTSRIDLATRWGNLLMFATTGIMLYALPPELGIRHETLTAFILGLLFVAGPIGAMLGVWDRVGQARVALRKLDSLGFDLSRVAMSVPEHRRREWPGKAPSTLEFRSARYRYSTDDDEDGFEVGPIDLRIDPGEVVFLVGGNGSGKTTLAYLLLGLYSPDSGRLLFGGVDIDDGNREEYRQKFSVVFADPYLFDRVSGRGGRAHDQVANTLLNRFQLAHKVLVEDGRYSRLDLSHGQRKRLALVSTMLDDRPIYVFDEWASDQDPIFKEFFYKTLIPELKARGKTVILVTHDDRYFNHADRCIKLENGRIVAESRGAPRFQDAVPGERVATRNL